MAGETTYTQAQLDAINVAIAAGVTRVSYGDKAVDYRSLSEMKRIAAEIAAVLSNRPIRRRFLSTSRSSKGL